MGEELSYFDAVSGRRLLLLCGSGGVGKTTLAAATGLGLARRGRKVLVMTIDPARRLRDALGIPEVHHEPTPVPLEASGTMEALMVHPEHTMDGLMRRQVNDDATFEQIRQNPLYQEARGNLPGSIEYIALGKLHQLATETDYDHILVDTAPMDHALEFFQAPERLLQFMDSSILSSFLQPKGAMRMVATGLGSGPTALFERLEEAIGMRFVRDVVDFINLFDAMYDDFRDRVRDMQALFTDETQTGFLVVGGAHTAALRGFAALSRELEGMGLPLIGGVLNRTCPSFPPVDTRPHGEGEMATLADRLIEGHQRLDAMARTEARRIHAALKSMDGPLWHVPWQPSDTSDLLGLQRIADTIQPFRSAP